MASIGSASLQIQPSFQGFQSDLDRGTGKAMTAAGVKGGTQFGDSAGKAASGKFGVWAKRMGKVAALGLAGAAAGAVKFSADAVQAASDLEESTNKLQQVFGADSVRIEKFAGRAAKALGQTNLEARNAASTFGIFGKAAKLTERQNVKFAKQMTTLASDLASFHNVEPDEAIEALGSALRGEAEPMRKFGVLLDADTLKAEALAEGLIKPVKDLPKIQKYQVALIEKQKAYNDAVDEHGAKSLEAMKAQANLEWQQSALTKAREGSLPALTQEQKILAARSVILKQTSDAQGDFARTSDGLANQQRILKARWEDSKIALGEVLLPTINDAVSFLNDKGIPAFERFSDWFVDTGIPAVKDFGGFIKDDVVPNVKKLIGFLDDLPKPAKYAGLVALLGGVGAMKLRGGNLGGGGALGTVGKALGIAKPVPVIVMNKGFGAGGGLPAGAGGGTTKVPPVVAPNGSTLAKGSRFLKFAPLLPAAGALGNDQLPDLMTDKQAKDFERYHANIERATNFWTDHERVLRDGTIPTVDLTHQKFDDLFSMAKKVDKSDPKINLFLDGYGDLTAKLRKLEGDLNWIARPRYIRMIATVQMAEAGYQTRGGLQATTEGARGGVTVNVGRVEAKDYDDLMTQLQRKAHRAALEGRRVG